MKTISAIVVVLLVAWSTRSTIDSVSMPGAYRMLVQSFKSNKVDTTFTSRQQLKIYTDDYMMYANFDPSDSSGSFGIGGYTARTDTVTENIFYSASDSSKSDTARTFVLGINKTDKGHRQVIPDIPAQGDHFRLTEEYERVGTIKKSPIDGTWKMVRMYGVNGKDTTSMRIEQYKVYAFGHYIFGHTYSDSTNRTHTGMGFGTFTMNGNNKLTELATASTYREITGKNIDLDITLNGANGYTQSYTIGNGRYTEVYQRLNRK